MIRSLAVRNLRSLVDVHLDLSAPTTLVVGANGAGKSTLANAILYALAGWCEWTDQRGSGFADLIRHGAGQANIDLDGDFGAVMRSLTASGSALAVDNRTGKQAQAILETQFPDKELLAVMLRSDGFIGLTDKERQDVLFRLAGGAADTDWFASHLTEEECEALRDDLATRLTGSALAESLYKSAFAKRTEANRGVKAAQARQKPADGRTAANIEEELKNARKALLAAQKQMGTAEANAIARARYEQVQTQRARLEKALADLGSPPDCETDEQVAQMQKQLASMEEQRRALGEQRAGAAAQAEAFEQSIKDFENLGGECVLGGVQCPLGEEARADALATIKTAAAKAREKANVAAAELNAVGHAIAEQKQTIAAAQQRRQYADTWKRREGDLQRQIAALEQFEAPPADNSADLRKSLQSQQALVARLEVEHRMALEYEVASKLDAEVTARAKMLDELVGKLAPTGLPAQAMRETVGKVLDAVNACLAEFCDFSLNADLDVVDATGETTALRLLSESEQLMVGAAISVAVAKLTGFGFVVVDAADRLDTTHRGPLMRMLMRSGVQSLVLATPLSDKVPHADGLAVYKLGNGYAQVVGEPEGVAA